MLTNQSSDISTSSTIPVADVEECAVALLKWENDVCKPAT